MRRDAYLNKESNTHSSIKDLNSVVVRVGDEEVVVLSETDLPWVHELSFSLTLLSNGLNELALDSEDRQPVVTRVHHVQESWRDFGFNHVQESWRDFWVSPLGKRLRLYRIYSPGNIIQSQNHHRMNHTLAVDSAISRV